MRNSQLLYTANSVCVLIMSSVLLGAFYFQFGLQENPCPLCLLQRMGMLGVIVGISLNTYFGFKSEHVAVVLISALAGVTFSIRQVLLHICPVLGEPTGYGMPILGMHLYSWGVVIFGASILGVALFSFVLENEPPETSRTPSVFEKRAFYFASFLCFANIIATLAECHLGPCCENGPCP